MSHNVYFFMNIEEKHFFFCLFLLFFMEIETSLEMEIQCLMEIRKGSEGGHVLKIGISWVGSFFDFEFSNAIFFFALKYSEI